MTSPFWNREDVLHIARGHMQDMCDFRQSLPTGTELTPHFMFFAEQNGELQCGIVEPPPLRGAALGEALRSLAERIGAHYTLFFSEIFVVSRRPGEDLPTPGSFRDLPPTERQEALSIIVEGIGGYQCVIQRIIRPDGSFEDMTESSTADNGLRLSGRMTNLCGRRDES